MADEMNGKLHFKELHLFPRVIFAIGSILFVTSLLHGNHSLGSLGLAIVFLAVSYNLWFDRYINKDYTYPENERARIEIERKFLKRHSIASLIVALLLFGAHFYYHHHPRHHATTDPIADSHRRWF